MQRLARTMAAMLCLLGMTGIDIAIAEDLAPPTVGEVVAVAGKVTAQRPGEGPRPLECGGAVYEGDVLATASAAQVGILADALYLQAGGDTTLALGRTRGRVVAMDLRAGQVRVIDPRDDGNPAILTLVGSETRLAGGDGEAYVLAEKVGIYGMVCDWDAPFEVRRGDERRRAEPGECVIARPRDPLYTAAVHPQRMALAADACPPPREAPIVGALTPAAAPARVVRAAGFPPPFAVAELSRSPCDVPGADCGGAGVFGPDLPPAEVPVVIDPSPDVDFCAPGVPGC